jgi:hypothetical protein
MANLTLIIDRIGDELEVFVQDDPTDDQKGRRGAPARDKPHGRNREIKELKRKRKQNEAGGDHDLASGPHQTLILVDLKNDKVTFKSALPFVVDVVFDPAYFDPTEGVEPLRSPFLGWDKPQSSQPTGTAPHPHEVKDAQFKDDKRDGINGTKPSDYHFYKMTVWCDGLIHDPDWYCDR